MRMPTVKLYFLDIVILSIPLLIFNATEEGTFYRRMEVLK